MANEILTKRKNEKILISSSSLCEVFEITPRSLINWERDGLKKEERGWWELKEVIRYRGMGNSTSTTGRERSLAEKKLIAEIDLKEAQTEISRLKNDIMNGKYLEAYYVESELKRFFTVFKRSCLNLARKVSGIAATYVEPKAARMLENEINKTITDGLQQLSVGGVINGKK